MSFLFFLWTFVTAKLNVFEANLDLIGKMSHRGIVFLPFPNKERSKSYIKNEQGAKRLILDEGAK